MHSNSAFYRNNNKQTKSEVCEKSKKVWTKITKKKGESKSQEDAGMQQKGNTTQVSATAKQPNSPTQAQRTPPPRVILSHFSLRRVYFPYPSSHTNPFHGPTRSEHAATYGHLHPDRRPPSRSPTTRLPPRQVRSRPVISAEHATTKTAAPSHINSSRFEQLELDPPDRCGDLT